MKKIFIVLVAVLALVLVVSPVAVFAGSPDATGKGVVDPLKLWDPPPPWFGDVVKVIPAKTAPGGQIRVVSDPLNPVDGSQASGLETFWCQSNVGFQYSIFTTGLDPLTRYSVMAIGAKVLQLVDEGTQGAFPLEPGVWVLPITPEPVELNLGGFIADANGLGGVKGTIILDAPFVYEVQTTVSDADGPVLETPGDDLNGFIVY